MEVDGQSRMGWDWVGIDAALRTIEGRLATKGSMKMCGVGWRSVQARASQQCSGLWRGVRCLLLVTFTVIGAGLWASSMAAAADATAWEPAESIRQVVEHFVRSRLPQQSQDARITVQGPVEGLHFPRCGHMQARDFGAANPFGAQTVEVACLTPQVWSLYLPVQVAWPQGAVVAARALSAGHVLTEDDLAVVQRDLSSLPAGVITKPAQAIGRVLQYGVAAGQSFTHGMLAGPQLIHYGQSVSLVALGQGIRLVALGTAMGNGRQGQTILARNVQSGKVVTGVVDGAGQIMVAMGP
jgi:flagella basal body P-ring formation protein FlgA